MPTPTYKIDIEKQLGTEFWSNSYLTDDPGLIDAIATAQDIVARERLVTHNTITFTKFRVSDVGPGGVTSTVVIGLPGQGNASGTVLPLFNVARVDFTAAAGRPSRKYLRGAITTGAVLPGGMLEATIREYINTSYANPMAADLNYVDVQGDEINSGACNMTIGMRQLRRGSKRRLNPIIP
jgi:hypothetical protein